MNYINRIILIVFLVFANKTAFAQTSPTDTAKFNVVQDSRINSLLEKHIQINSKAPIKGYRVKIHFGSDKSKAKEVKAKFISKFQTKFTLIGIINETNYLYIDKR